MIPSHKLDRLFSALIALALLVICIRAGHQIYRHYHPIARVTVSEVLDPAPVRSVCDWIPDHTGCPKADRMDTTNAKDRN